MSTNDDKGGTALCREVEEELARVVDGTAAHELFEHIASCDACRDARYEASRAAERIAEASADYVHPSGFDEKLLAALDAKRAKPSPEPAPEPEPVNEASQAPPKPTPANEAQKPAPPTKDAPKPDQPAPAPPKGDSNVVDLASARARRLRLGVLALAGLAAVAAAFAIGVKSGPKPAGVTAGSVWSGRISSVSRASADKAGGVERCSRSGACEPARVGDDLPAGARLRTDGRTRAHVTLADGTDVALDRDTELELDANKPRTARLSHGTVVADVAHLEDAPNARVLLPRGSLEVVGTKFSLTAQDDRASVEVMRGTVRLSGEGERTVLVHAGEEGRVFASGAPVVAPALGLADSADWSDRDADKAKDETIRGLGELRAKKPGESQERDHAVRLARHGVKVRVVDTVARTEIDETFTSESGDVLEGIFRFPLPPDAQIERLALEVNGKMEEGAFVERDKAAAIWRGVLQHAAPQSKPKPFEDIIWVPGPWRDPALLEWQRGGRFELKIFPIPAHGSRRVVLAYTQVLPPSAGVRRYTYPLAYDPSGSTTVDQFDVDVAVLGQDKAFGVKSKGYKLEPSGGADEGKLVYSATKFVPAGDLSFEYALPDRDAEATAWAYQPEGGEAPYVAIALRPKLPKWSDDRERDQVIVVDASRSMIGERFARASKLAASIVREMDRRDRFHVLACDTTCRPMSSDATIPGPSAAAEVERFLSHVEPEGGTDLVAAVKAARSIASSRGGRELRVVYLGDGTPSVGPIKPDHVTSEVLRVLPAGEGSVTAVAIGSDADTTSLAALARGGGGVVVPYVPGQRAQAAALAVLSATYGIALREPTVELPPGLVELSPAKLDTIPAGGEAIVVARIGGDASGKGELSGDLKLRGKVGGDSYEQTIPLRILATTAKGNAFVPRLYAATRIGDLERTSGDAAKTDVIGLSKRFAVASRYTSLLVLESEAMFDAYKLDRSRTAPTWTGDERADSTSGKGDNAYEAPDPETASAADKAKDEAPGGGLGLSGVGSASGFGSGGGGRAMAPSAVSGPSDMAPSGNAAERAMPAPAAAPTAAAPMPMKKPAADRGDAFMAPPASAPPPRPETKQRAWGDDILVPSPPPPRRQRMIPMRRIWNRKGTVATDVTRLHDRDGSLIDAAERALSAAPDSRAKVKDLYKAYAVAGRLDRASEVATRWSSRDPLDPEALVARADLAARKGDREAATRILGSVVDVRPDDVAAQTRLAQLQDFAGNRALACEHRIALADLRSSDGALVAAAVRCAREQSMGSLADRLVADAPSDAVRRAIDKALAAAPLGSSLRGDVQIEASWSDDADLDLALVDPTGQRLSWLGGGKAAVTARDATSTRGEGLGFANLGAGSYVVEITRGAGATGPVHGTLTVRAVGETRTLPFTIDGSRVELGTVRVYYDSQLVPVEGWR